MSQSKGLEFSYSGYTAPTANMADGDVNVADTKIHKGARLLVTVEEALPDILVVSYGHGAKLFQGVLLDSTKRNLPCGVSSLHPAYTAAPEDRLYSSSQRFTYLEGGGKVTSAAGAAASSTTASTNGKAAALGRPLSRIKTSRMTVRLRPRQVLCSKCRGICNENSENVDASSRKRKATEPHDDDAGDGKGDDNNGPKEQRRGVVELPERSATAGRALRKKRAANSTENHPSWNGSAIEQPGVATATTTTTTTTMSAEIHGAAQNTRTIKISYGREGEGTVLKIPPANEFSLSPMTTPSPQSSPPPPSSPPPLQASPPPPPPTLLPKSQPISLGSSKAARRALKKAKKEARRKIMLSGGEDGGGGGVDDASACYPEGLVPRRHKHKVKHKRRHRDEQPPPPPAKPPDFGVGSQDQHELSSPFSLPLETAPADESLIHHSPEVIRERCLSQKLSISLRRLNASAYASCSAAAPASSVPAAGGGGGGSGSGPEDGGSEGDGDGGVPDFPTQQRRPTVPPPPPPATDDRLSVGDVVWGKIHGFPWWPGKVTGIPAPGQAHVSWYGSSTSSLMACDQLSPFLENFKVRYNRKKRGPYKEAIKQATCEARALAMPSSPPPAAIVTTPTRPTASQQQQEVVSPLVRPALASPREIDVVS